MLRHTKPSVISSTLVGSTSAICDSHSSYTVPSMLLSAKEHEDAPTRNGYTQGTGCSTACGTGTVKSVLPSVLLAMAMVGSGWVFITIFRLGGDGGRLRSERHRRWGWCWGKGAVPERKATRKNLLVISENICIIKKRLTLDSFIAPGSWRGVGNTACRWNDLRLAMEYSLSMSIEIVSTNSRIRIQ